jgi:hypothetical protein
MFKGLFDNQSNKEIEEQEQEFLYQQKRSALCERAGQFDLTALDDAEGDAQLYQEILDIFINRGLASQEDLQALVSHISKSRELSANARLAELMIETFKNSPNKRTLSQMLHLAARSADATLYEKSIESAIEFWKQGLLPQLPGKDLLALVESEYWLLSSEAKRSGAGFVLKESLARLRRDLQ